MEGQPTPASAHKFLERDLLVRSHAREIARVRDQKIRRRESAKIAVVPRHSGPNVRVLTEQLQQFHTSEIEIVPAAAANQIGVDGLAHAGSNSSGSVSMPRSRILGG